MRMLFIALGMQDMYKDIEGEMTRLGHDVVVVRDISLRSDPYRVGIRLFVHLEKIVWNRLVSKHWKKYFGSVQNIV